MPKDAADILCKQFRSSDIIGRVRGDEFVLLLRDMRTADFIEWLAEKLNTLLRKAYQEGDKSVTTSASIGLEVASQDGNTFQKLYQKPIKCSIRSKRKGKTDLNGMRWNKCRLPKRNSENVIETLFCQHKALVIW